MTVDLRLVIFLLLMCLVGCGAELAPTSEPPTPVEPPPAAVAADPAVAPTPAPPPKKGLWIVGLPVPETLAGCAFWAETGLSCIEAAAPQAAYITITAEDNPECPADANGIVWLGSGGPGHASIHLSCFLGAVGTDPGITGYYEAAVAHEIGHAMGLSHVPEEADAVMRPITPRQGGITDIDRMEFMRVWGTSSPP